MALIRINILSLVALLLIASPVTDLFGQDSPFDPALAREASRISEQVVIFTDRSLYIAGEEVWFGGEIIRTGLADDASWSQVLYLEFVTPSGSRLASAKYAIRDDRFTGEMEIPSTVLSGDYYLRGYTRWMRNKGPVMYCYVPVRVVNPFNENVTENEYVEGPVKRMQDLDMEIGPMFFRSHPAIYHRNDSITLVLALPEDNREATLTGCLTVVPRLASPKRVTVEKNFGVSGSDSTFMVSFLPDLNGITLSGTLVDAGGALQSVSDRRIHLTAFGEQPDYMVTRTGMDGRFNVSLPARDGYMELFIQSEERPGENGVIRIDQDFDPRHIQLPATSFYLTDSQLHVATIMARNTQLSQIFRNSEVSVADTMSRYRVPFYGTPSFSLHMDDYVLLPTLEETFINLVPMVSPVRKKQSLSLVIHSENPALHMYPSLIMIDEVPYFDLHALMSLPSAAIERIDVVNDVYLKGGIKFGGIINFRTREGDLTGIALPENAFFFDYQVFRPRTAPEMRGISFSRMPDTRNTIYWIPELEVSSHTPVQINFPAPEYPGIYSVLYRNISEDGGLRRAETFFQVR